MSEKMTPKYSNLLGEIKTFIEQSKAQVAISVNATMSMLYWQIGNRINTEILEYELADYGKEVVVVLARELTAKYGQGWSEKQLWHCIRFVQVFPDVQIVSTLWRELTWSHIKVILYLEDPLKREFYIEMSKLEGWSVRTQKQHTSSRISHCTTAEKTIAGKIAQSS